MNMIQEPFQSDQKCTAPYCSILINDFCWRRRAAGSGRGKLVEVSDSYDCQITCPRLVLSHRPTEGQIRHLPCLPPSLSSKHQHCHLVFITQCTVIITVIGSKKQKCWNERKDATNRKDSTDRKVTIYGKNAKTKTFIMSVLSRCHPY